RRMRRHRTLVSSAAAALIVALAAGVVIVNQLRVQAATGRGLVTALETAETAHGPELIGQLHRHRRWAEPLLDAPYPGQPAGPKARLHAALALKPVDADRREYLRRTSLDPATGPEELLVIRAALREEDDELAWNREVWQRLEPQAA